MSAKRKNKSKKKLYAVSGLIFVIIAAGISYKIIHKNNTNNLAINSSSKQVTGATSKSTSQPSSSQTPATSTPTNSGGVVDKNGQSASNLPPSANWATSSSGDITLQLPSLNQTLQSGDTIAGLANVSMVQFILTDNSVGQIAQGNLSVVNGKFSGTLYFTAHADSGTLEVYYPNPNNGAEEDIVSIDVNFSS